MAPPRIAPFNRKIQAPTRPEGYREAARVWGLSGITQNPSTGALALGFVNILHPVDTLLGRR